MPFDLDPDAPADGGLFGLPHGPEHARVLVLPVPFDATTSFHEGTAGAPERVLEASHQVDLCDPSTRDPWREGMAMVEAAPWVAPLSVEARKAALKARDLDEDDPARAGLIAEVDAAGERVTNLVQTWVAERFADGRIPAVLGGDHSVPLGAFRAAIAEHPGLGFLHVDAHADLRVAYEGFAQSHASIFHNALEIPEIGPVVQVGIRDFGTRERERWLSDSRLHTWTDHAIADHLHRGGAYRALVERMIEPLPEVVWISFDIDGLDPSLCSATGTPVPGGLSWREALTLLEVLGTSGRRIVGFDLCEVGDHEWDANVGARLLYKLAGWAIATGREA